MVSKTKKSNANSCAVFIYLFQAKYRTYTFIYTGIPLYEPVGCFQDSGATPRPLPRLLQDYRPHMNWNDIEAVIQHCAALANQIGYRLEPKIVHLWE